MSASMLIDNPLPYFTTSFAALKVLIEQTEG
jgi:hypothetical protein